MEESHEIFNLTDFWLDTLFYLARECAKHDAVLARELQETHADLTDRWLDRELADRVRATVLDAADRLGKKLVLMVENLQTLCEDVDEDFGWQLRGTLQSEPQIMLLATATSRFKGLDDAEEPFFEQFRIIDLEPLNYRRMPSSVAGRQRRRGERRWNQAARDSDRWQSPPSGHRRRVRAAPITAPVDGRTGDADRRAYRIFPRSPGGLA